MTVATTSNEIDFTGISTAPLTFPNPVHAAGELYVYIVDADGVEALRTVITDYAIALALDLQSATVTPTAGLVTAATGKTLRLRRTIPLSQSLDLANAARLNSAGIDKAFDRATMGLQQLNTRIGKAESSLDDAELASASADEAAASALAAAASALAAAASADAAAVSAQTATLGTAAAEDVEAFATAAQGAKANSATQPEDLPWVIAAHNGVPGDGTDQTTALQAIIDGLPTEGGQILLSGDVRWTTLTAYQRRNIRFVGLGGYGAGATQRTTFRCTSGALGNGVSAFNLKQTMNVSFEQLVITNSNTAFTGTLLDWGDLTTGSALMTLRDCIVNVSSNVSGARGINIYGATQGTFERVKFLGASTLVQMQNAPGVGWCNNHHFRCCSFNPSGSSYPVSGSGEGITFLSCNVQASSGDGIGRFWRTDLTQQFRNVNIIGCTFYDVLTTGGIWANFYTGKGLNIIGNMVGGAADITAGNNYGFQIGGGTDGVSGSPLGVVGGACFGNEFRYMTAAFGFGGTAGTYDNVRAMQMGPNTCYGSLTPSGNAVLYSNASSTENMTWMASEEGSTSVDRALALLSGLTPASNKLPYFSGSGSAALADLTSFARTLLAASSAGAVTTALGVREGLTANRTYYVDKALGNNSNDGLASGSGRAFATVQKAIDTACGLDLNIYSVTINVADGTGYAAFGLKSYVGVGPINIIGNTTTPANVDLSGSSTNITGGGWNCAYVIKGMKVANSAGNGMAFNGPGTVALDNIEFGACTGAHIRADKNCLVSSVSGHITISGNAGYGYLAGYGATIDLNNCTITYSANVAYATAHAYGQVSGIVNVQSVTFTLGGFTVTGKRYNSVTGGYANSNGAGATFIPGDVAGTGTYY